MRTAAICPTCSTYENALCIIYNGEYLTNIDVNQLDSIETAIVKINNNVVPLTGTVPPVDSATYLGQLYVDTAAPTLYFAESVGTGPSDWMALGATTPLNTSSGTYIPVLVPISNVSSLTAYNTHYTRVEGEVTVQGLLDVTASGLFELIIALPISSTLSSVTDVTGFTNQSGQYIEADVVNNQALLTGTLVGSATIRFFLSYTIL